MSRAVAFGCGVLFAVGLIVSGMTRPAVVIAFLDLLGDWDPALALVMVGAIGVMAVAWRRQSVQPEPLSGASWQLPAGADIDAPLVGGAVMFGVGWGLSGFCPAPAIVSVGAGGWHAPLFAVSMAGGMWIHHLWSRPAAVSEPWNEPVIEG